MEKTIMIKGKEYKINEICEVCGEPISVIAEDGSVRDVACLCERVANAKKRQVYYDKLGGLVIKSNATLENFKEKEEIDFQIKELIENYIEKFESLLTGKDEEGVGILLLGNSGVGKTFACSCIVNTMNDRGYTYLALNLSRYLALLRPNSGEVYTQTQILDAIRDVDLLFVDDLGSENLNRENGKEWGNEMINNLFETRIQVNKPIIVTSNFKTSDEIKEHLKFKNSDKTYSRFIGMMRNVIIHNGKDKRLANKKFKGF